jgi:predicted ATPase
MFVGREREMDALRHALEQAKAGHGQIVAAIAEPGVGKSRLFYEFKAISQSGCMVLEALSVSHDKASAYLPVIDLLHLAQSMGMTRGLGRPEAGLALLRARELCATVGERAALFTVLVGLMTHYTLQLRFACCA